MKPEPTSNSPVRERLRFLAEQVGGPSALAGLVGVHPTSLFGYLKDRKITTARLHAIAARYPCSLEWLEHGKGDAPQPDPDRTMRALAASRQIVLDGFNQAVAATNERFKGPQLVLAKAKQAVLLEKARERVCTSLQGHERAAIEAVLGPALTQEVLAGRCCPSLEIICKLAPALGLRTMWMLGLED